MELETDNKMPLRAGMLCEYRVRHAGVLEIHRVRLLERQANGAWRIMHLDGFLAGEVAAGWFDRELYPSAEPPARGYEWTMLIDPLADLAEDASPKRVAARLKAFGDSIQTFATKVTYQRRQHGETCHGKKAAYLESQAKKAPPEVIPRKR